MCSVIFFVVYSFVGTISLVTGVLGMLFPFFALGDFSPFYDTNTLGTTDETELLTVHLARMSQSLTFNMGLSFFLLRRESQRVRATLLAVNSIVTLWYSLGEIYLDTPRAVRLLGATLVKDWSSQIIEQEKYSRSVQFLMGSLDGGSVGAACIALVGLVVASVAMAAVPYDENEPERKKER